MVFSEGKSKKAAGKKGKKDSMPARGVFQKAQKLTRNA
jgi:hypothetical protein